MTARVGRLTLDQAIAQRELGLSYKAIAQHAGISRQAVQAAFARHAPGFGAEFDADLRVARMMAKHWQDRVDRWLRESERLARRLPVYQQAYDLVCQHGVQAGEHAEGVVGGTTPASRVVDVYRKARAWAKHAGLPWPPTGPRHKHGHWTRAILAALEDGPLTFAQIQERTGIPAGGHQRLASLEDRGLVRRTGRRPAVWSLVGGAP